jgi:hypothetical protein
MFQVRKFDTLAAGIVFVRISFPLSQPRLIVLYEITLLAFESD